MSESSVVNATYTINTLIEWQHMLGGDSDNKRFYSIQQTSDGGYIIFGSLGNITPGTYIGKIDSGGEIEWEKIFRGSVSGNFSSVQQTSDGGYILGGTIWSDSNKSDYLIIKLNSDLEIEWQKIFGGSDSESYCSVQQTNDGGYIIGGNSYSEDIPGVTNHGGSDYYIIKINSGGNIVWQRMYIDDYADKLSSILQTNDGGYILAGTKFYNSGIWRCIGDFNWEICGYRNDEKPHVMKINASGSTIEWQYTYGNVADKIVPIQPANDGGYIFAVNPNEQNEESYIIKLNSSGNKEWQQYNGDDYCKYNSIQQTSDGGYILGGKYGSDYYVFKTNSRGNKEWQQMYGGSLYDECRTVQQTSDGGYILGGDSQSEDIPGVTYIGLTDFYIIKLKGDYSQFEY